MDFKLKFDSFLKKKEKNTSNLIDKKEVFRKKPLFFKLLKKLFWVGFIFLLFIFLINFYIIYSSRSQVFYQTKDLPEYQTVLLLGAKVYQNKYLSLVMQDRADTAIELYNLGKVKKILVSGDHSTKDYDEVNTIKNYLLRKGISEVDIFTDHAGLDTYDSIYRAKNIFEVESIIIVTQKFHLSRAIYLANSLEIKNIGIVADKRPSFLINSIRELLARVKAFFDIILSSQPKFYGEKIPITGDSKKSFD